MTEKSQEESGGQLLSKRELPSEDAMRQECWNSALYAFGTSYVFQERQRWLQKKLLWIQYSGIAIPVVMGTTIMSFGVELSWLPVMIAVASILLGVQLVLSLWSTMAHWVERLAYTYESVAANDTLSRRYSELARTPPKGARFRNELEIMRVQDSARRDLDIRQHLSEKEKRRGMHAALRQFGRACATCGVVPTTFKPSKCDTCGNF
ncbi:mobilome CxxCx(11)CxxC protein [Micromonospora sp. WMMD1082]|uniref:mobilome CxxCx(11)CxxC protein n=1 Tax=Micromonospora sp. WMMD1082 TaxID=3016104 RepID=UPI002417669D|nr:mobilome CxxCx(11)CxxC protein [Micromonospora sp. WMMD1082]MDG4794050.1 hypothetical protein [Micromonospora sp. WMMD1082]